MLVLAWAVAGLAGIAAVIGWSRAARRSEAEQRLAVRDVEFDRVRARAVEVAAREANLSQALEAIPQGVVIGDEHGAIAYRNAAAQEFLNARHGEALVEGVIRELLAEAASGHEVVRSLELFGPPRRVLDIMSVPLAGPTKRNLILVEDVSDRRRLEAVRRDFVANISHELKTPVGALGLLAETLVDEDDPEVIRPLAARMVEEAFRVNRTIDDLLELSRIEAGEAPVRQPVPVDQVLAGAVERIRPAADLRSISIDIEDPPPGLTVVGDRRQLVSAIYNLLDNAVKYSEPGHEVSLRAEIGAPSSRPSGAAGADEKLVDIVVADQGLGIPARDIERVFERFYRVDRARSRGTGGTGLGLAIVRHVAGNHDGEVSVESAEGVGSTFRLRLPQARPSADDRNRERTNHGERDD